MPNVEWNIPMTLTSPQGTLKFNDETAVGPRYMLDPTKCLFGPETLRTTTDDNPQADGGIVHRAFRSLMIAKLAPQFWIGEAADSVARAPACGSDLCEMYDTLMLHLNALVSPTQAQLDGSQCRLVWTPSCGADRMFDRIQMLGWSNPTNDGVVLSDEFTFQSPWPYAMTAAQELTSMTVPNPSTYSLDNAGTSRTWPVFRVYGPCDGFSIYNHTTGLEIDHLGTTLPGGTTLAAGHYAEINTFHNTIYLDGNSSNLIAGVDVEFTDFFPLEVGVNVLGFDSASKIDVLWNVAWA